jgi:hypothetical protein
LGAGCKTLLHNCYHSGDYTVTVTSANCTATETITVLPVAPPEILSVETFDWTEDNNGLTVVTATPDMANTRWMV